MWTDHRRFPARDRFAEESGCVSKLAREDETGVLIELASEHCEVSWLR